MGSWLHSLYGLTLILTDIEQGLWYQDCLHFINGK